MKAYKVLEITVNKEATCEMVGDITLQDTETGEIEVNAIWYSEDGEHYFCFDTGETDDDDEEILEDMLISDVSVGDIIN